MCFDDFEKTRIQIIQTPINYNQIPITHFDKPVSVFITQKRNICGFSFNALHAGKSFEGLRLNYENVFHFLGFIPCSIPRSNLI